MFGFEKLEVWQNAVEFALKIYESKSRFPSDERFGLTSQLRRASVSISSNIAEGSGRKSRADFAHFVGIAYSSLLECVSQLHMSRRLNYVDQSTHQILLETAESLARMLSALRKSLKPST